jgi:propionyl-CoA synthetase
MEEVVAQHPDVAECAMVGMAIVVERLPKTRSGKILGRSISKIADGEAFSVPSTIR